MKPAHKKNECFPIKPYFGDVQQLFENCFWLKKLTVFSSEVGYMTFNIRTLGQILTL